MPGHESRAPEMVSPLELPDGSVAQITSARVLTPAGNKLDGVGIEPDYEVDMSVDDWVQGRDPQLARALDLLKNDSSETS